MNKKYLKIGLIGGGVILGSFLAFKLVKSLINRDRGYEDEGDVIPSEPTAKKLVFNQNRVVGLGSKDVNGQTEVKTIQVAMNNIIEDMKKAITPTKAVTINPSNPYDSWANSNTIVKNTPSYVDVQVDSEKEKRRKEIAGLKKLNPDGDFGKATLNVVKKIMGSYSTTYAKVKQKRIDFASSYGLKKPY